MNLALAEADLGHRQPELLSLADRVFNMKAESDMNIRSSLAVDLEKMTQALRASELARILSTSKMTIYRLVKQGDIPYFRVGGLIRFDPQAVADWLRRKMPSGQSAA